MTLLSTTEALRTALSEELARDPAVFLLGEDIGAYGGAFGVTRGLLDRFGPERVIDTPISESSVVGAAIGAALAGSRPVVEIMFMDFLTLCMDHITLAVDQLANQAAKLRYVLGPQARCPVVVRTPAGGGRCYGPTHSQSLEALFLHIPGLRIAVPATPADARGLLKTAIVAWSRMTVEAERAAAELAEEEVAAEVIDLRTLSPLDMDTVAESVRKTHRLLIVEEGTRTGGAGAEIAAQAAEAAFEYLDRPVRRVATPDVPVPASPVLERAALPNAGRIVEAALEMMDMG